MASRQTIREAVYSELESAASGLVDPEHITQEHPNQVESLPAIVHNDAYRPLPMNTNTGVTDETRVDGAVETLHYSQPIEAQFSILILASDELEKETIYEAVRTHFGEFERPIRDTDSMHADVSRVEVGNADSQDDEDREPTARGDALTVNVTFERIYDRNVDDIQDVQRSVDTTTG